jgi:hypothetical protein
MSNSHVRQLRERFVKLYTDTTLEQQITQHDASFSGDI